MPKKIYLDPSIASDNTGVKVGVGVIILNFDGCYRGVDMYLEKRFYKEYGAE